MFVSPTQTEAESFGKRVEDVLRFLSEGQVSMPNGKKVQHTAECHLVPHCIDLPSTRSREPC